MNLTPASRARAQRAAHVDTALGTGWAGTGAADNARRINAQGGIQVTETEVAAAMHQRATRIR